MKQKKLTAYRIGRRGRTLVEAFHDIAGVSPVAGFQGMAAACARIIEAVEPNRTVAAYVSRALRGVWAIRFMAAVQREHRRQNTKSRYVYGTRDLFRSEDTETKGESVGRLMGFVPSRHAQHLQGVANI